MKSWQYFDKVALEYTSSYYAQTPSGYYMRIRQQRVLEGLDTSKGKILDVGCGPGILAEKLIVQGHEVWGVDASPRMIEHCRERIDSRNAHFSTGDAMRLSFPDGFFDVVISTGLIDRLHDYQGALKEMARVVRKNGTMLISFSNLLSPYAAWRNFVYFPSISLLRPMYYRLLGRRPPVSYFSFANLQTPRRVTRLMETYGVAAAGASYYNFNLFLSPLDELLPRPAVAVTGNLERLRFGNLKWLATGFIWKGKKR